MKTIKKITRGILTLFLMGCIGLLFLSMHLESMLGSILKETMKSQLEAPITTLLKDKKLIDEQIKDEDITNILLKDEQINKLYDQYSNAILKGMIDEKELENLDLSTDISNIIKSHQEELQEKLQITITDEQIETFSNEVAKSPIVKEKVSEMKNQLSSEEQEILNTYSFIISKNFKLILGGLIILLTFAIALLYPSTYRWLSNIAFAITMASIGNFIFIPMFKSIVDYYFQEQLNILTEIKVKNELTHTAWMLGLGIVLYVLYYTIKYLIKKNHETN